MARPSLEDRAIEALDQALVQTDPISRMMLIERALNLHRRSMEARGAATADTHRPRHEAPPRPPR